MDHVKPQHFAKMLSDLTGRRVAVAAAAATSSNARQVLGSYLAVPAGYTITIKIDLPLLGSLGGTLVGLPDQVVKQNLAQPPLDEMLRDAMHEVLNVLSSLVTDEGRAVLKNLDLDPAAAQSTFSERARRPHFVSHYDVTVPGYQGGLFTLLTPLQVDPH